MWLFTLYYIHIYDFSHLSTELKSFLEKEIDEWTKELDQMEENYLKCEELDLQMSSPPRKRKKCKTKASTSVRDNENNMANLAASLKIAYITKVSHNFVFVQYDLLQQ